MNLLRAYDAFLIKAPLKTKGISSFLIFGLCEFNAQIMTNDARNDATFLDRMSQVDWRQVFGYGCLSIYNAPVMHSFYNVALRRQWSLPVRIATNSLIMDPCNIAVAMLLSTTNKCLCVGQSLTESLSNAVDTLEMNFVNTMKTSLMVWPLWHTINWVLIPQRYRVLGFNIGSLGWNTYLTYSMWMIEKQCHHEASSLIIDKSLDSKSTEVLPSSSSSTSNLVEEEVGTISKTGTNRGEEKLDIGQNPEPMEAPSSSSSSSSAICPAKFSYLDLSSYKHLCPYIKDKEKKEENSEKTITNSLVFDGKQPINKSLERNQKIENNDKLVINKEEEEKLMLLKKQVEEVSITNQSHSSWRSWLTSWVRPRPPTSCQSEGNDKNNDESNQKRILSVEDLRSIFGSHILIDSNNEEVKLSSLLGKVIVLYFSASWCPPCRRFTPILSETYHHVQQKCALRGEEVEFVLISADSNVKDYDAYRSQMPFLATPFAAAEGRLPMLKGFFEFRTIPHLVVIMPNGKVSNGSAVSAVYNDVRGDNFPWWDRPDRD